MFQPLHRLFPAYLAYLWSGSISISVLPQYWFYFPISPTVRLHLLSIPVCTAGGSFPLFLVRENLLFSGFLFIMCCVWEREGGGKGKERAWKMLNCTCVTAQASVRRAREDLGGRSPSLLHAGTQADGWDPSQILCGANSVVPSCGASVTKMWLFMWTWVSLEAKNCWRPPWLGLSRAGLLSHPFSI